MDTLNEIVLSLELDQVNASSEIRVLTDLALASVGGGIGDVVHA